MFNSFLPEARIFTSNFNFDLSFLIVYYLICPTLHHCYLVKQIKLISQTQLIEFEKTQKEFSNIFVQPIFFLLPKNLAINIFSLEYAPNLSGRNCLLHKWMCVCVQRERERDRRQSP